MTLAKHPSQSPFFRFRLGASPVIVFLTKLKTITACLEHDIFHNNLKDNIMDKPILTNIAGCYQNRNLLQIFSFSWMQLHLKKFHQIVLDVVTFNIRQDYSLQTRTLLNFITDDFMRVFWNKCADIFVKLSEKRMWWSSL